MGLAQKYAVLNDRLLPDKVAALLLDEQVGSALASIERSFVYTNSIQTQIEVRRLFENHTLRATSCPFTERHIESMIEKLLRNNGYERALINIRVYTTERSALYITSDQDLTASG